ncbi:MAG: pilin [bacterium]|nr:pilin [bacterium]
MSRFIIWFSRASGVLFVTLLGLSVAQPVYADFKVIGTSPDLIACPYVVIPNAHWRCMDKDENVQTKMSFRVSSSEPLLDNVTYLLRISKNSDPNNFGFAPAKKIPDNELIFEWDFNGIGTIRTDPHFIAQPGVWTLELYAPGKLEYDYGRSFPRFLPDQKKKLENTTFIIYEGPKKQPTFRAKRIRYPANTKEVEFEILNTTKSVRYEVWWDGETPGFGKSGTSEQSGSTLNLKLKWSGQARERGQLACMAIPTSGFLVGLKCEDFSTVVYFLSTDPGDGGGPSEPLGDRNGDPFTHELKTVSGGGVTRLIREPRKYERVIFCQEKQNEESGVVIHTGIGCIPTTPSALLGFLLRFAIGIGGGAALLIMAFGSIQMMTAQGDPEKLNEGREKFVGALAGLLFIVFSIFLLNVIGVQIFAIPGFPK